MIISRFNPSAYLALMFFLSFTCSAIASQQRSGYFLAIADLHFDPFIACQNNTATCSLITALQTAPVEEWAKLLAQSTLLPPKYKQDTSYILLAASLAKFKKISQTHSVDFALLLGDLLAHHYRERYQRYSGDDTPQGYQHFVRQTMNFLVYELNRALPGIPIYPLIGNNDSYGKHYTVEPIFYKEMTPILSKLLKDDPISQKEMTSLFPIGGYYALTLPMQKKLRLINLNTVLFSPLATSKTMNIAQAAQQELIWLAQTLQQAVQDQQKIILAMHIPPAIDVHNTLTVRPFSLIFTSFQDDYTHQLLEILTKYSKNMVGIYHAHLHKDWFQIFPALSQVSPPLFAIGTPSMSPLFKNNPAFKAVEYDRQSLLPTNYSTYYYPLNNRSPHWEKEYRFTEIYNPDCHQPSCQPVSVAIGAWAKQPGTIEHYKHYYSVSTPLSSMTDHFQYYWCQIYHATAADYQQCLLHRHAQ